MTRNDFMTALRKRISHLPLDEQDAALKYYEEYFDEAASEEEAAQQLGSPDLIADRILSDYGTTAPNAQPAKKQKYTVGYWVGISILLVFASPFILAFGAAGIAVLMALCCVAVAALIAIIVPFFALGVSLVACFFALLYAGAIALATWAPGGILVFGIAFLCGGGGILSCIFTGYLFYWIGLLIKSIFGGFKRNKVAKEARRK